MDLNYLDNLLAARAVARFSSLLKKMGKSGASASSKSNELFALAIEKGVRAHLVYMMFRFAKDYLSNHTFRDARIRPWMENLIRVYALH